MEKTYSLSTLKGFYRCNTLRESQWEKQEEKNILIEDMVRKAVLCALKGGTLADARVCLNGAYADRHEPDIIRAQREEDLWRYVERYIRSETRRPVNVQPAVIDIAGVNVSLYPDFCFFDGETLELVKLRVKKPDVTQNGKVLDGSANGSLGLYAMLNYAKRLASKNKQPIQRVKASFYFLRKANDVLDKGKFDADFFGKEGKNVISLSDNATFPTQKDQMFLELFKQFKDGENRKFSKKSCEDCPRYAVCNSNSPIPKPVPSAPSLVPLSQMRLNDEQKKAVKFEKGIARINAGAGSGKTLVVALRVVNLLMKGYKPEDIAVLTFSNSGAQEMSERITSYYSEVTKVSHSEAGQALQGMASMTFNALGDHILEENWKEMGFYRRPILIEEGERLALIEKLLVDNPVSGLSYRNFRVNEKNAKGGLAVASRVFSILKEYRLAEDGTISEEGLQFMMDRLDLDAVYVSGCIKGLVALYPEYKFRMKAESYIEYADQEWLMLDLAKANPGYFQNTGLKHIIVDEFQDTSARQMQIIRSLMTSKDFVSLMVVGDDSQSIYSFRETSPYNIIHFFDLVGRKGEDFYLLENHRSTPEIINMANGLNKLNKNRIPKDLVAVNGHGMRPYVQGFADTGSEMDFAVGQIVKWIMNGRKPEDIAYIAMTKAELLRMQGRLDELGIPNVLLAPEPMRDNPLVRGAEALYGLLQDPGDEIAAVTYLNACCGGKFEERPDARKYVDAWKSWAASLQTATAAYKGTAYVNSLAPLVAYHDEVFDAFYQTLAHKRTWNGLASYFAHLEIYGGLNEKRRELSYPGVTLTTAHSSKGLEWPACIVSVSKFDDTLVRDESRAEQLEERRRLLFVAITRARQELCVTGKYVPFGSSKLSKGQIPALNIFLDNLYRIQGRDLAGEFISRYADSGSTDRRKKSA